MTQIRISEELKDELDGLKKHPRETYGDVLHYLIDEHRKGLVKSK